MPTKQEILNNADLEIDAFEQWFRGEGAEPLARFEKAILKTFLVAKATKKFKPLSDQEAPKTSQDAVAPGYSHYLYRE